MYSLSSAILYVRVLVDVLFSLSCCYDVVFVVCCIMKAETSTCLSHFLLLCGSVVWGVVLWIMGKWCTNVGGKGGATEIFLSFFLSHGMVGGS